MGREIKRVPLEFEWPLNKVWIGFRNPFYIKCPKCEAGYSKAYRIVAKYINGLMFCREVGENKDVASLTTALCGRAPRPVINHDSIDAWRAMKKFGEMLELPDDWLECPHCGGSGIDPEIKETYELWERSEPPEGDGYQLWETVSEGSPISPVFSTPEELAKWLEDNEISPLGPMTCSYDQWLDFIRGTEWSLTGVLDNTGVHGGVCKCDKKQKTKGKG